MTGDTPDETQRWVIPDVDSHDCIGDYTHPTENGDERRLLKSESSLQKIVASEKSRLLDFFRGYDQSQSDVIASGQCPNCRASGRDQPWTMVGIGAKECRYCKWQDY